MSSTYLTYLKMTRIHSVFSVFERQHRHTNTQHLRHQAQHRPLTQIDASLIVLVRPVAILICLPPLHIRFEPRTLHAQLHMHCLVAINKLVRRAMMHARLVCPLDLAVD